MAVVPTAVHIPWSWHQVMPFTLVSSSYKWWWCPSTKHMESCTYTLLRISSVNMIAMSWRDGRSVLVQKKERRHFTYSSTGSWRAWRALPGARTTKTGSPLESVPYMEIIGQIHVFTRQLVSWLECLSGMRRQGSAHLTSSLDSSNPSAAGDTSK